MFHCRKQGSAGRLKSRPVPSRIPPPSVPSRYPIFSRVPSRPVPQSNFFSHPVLPRAPPVAFRLIFFSASCRISPLSIPSRGPFVLSLLASRHFPTSRPDSGPAGLCSAKIFKLFIIFVWKNSYRAPVISNMNLFFICSRRKKSQSSKQVSNKT